MCFSSSPLSHHHQHHNKCHLQGYECDHIHDNLQWRQHKDSVVQKIFTPSTTIIAWSLTAINLSLTQSRLALSWFPLSNKTLPCNWLRYLLYSLMSSLCESIKSPQWTTIPSSGTTSFQFLISVWSISLLDWNGRWQYLQILKWPKWVRCPR